MKRSAVTASPTRLGELDVDRAVLEERGREDDARGSERDERLRPFGRADAAADPAGKAGADRRDERLVRARVLGGIEVDELHLRVTGEALDPAVDVARLDGQALALHELDDPAALEIDRRYEHQSLRGHAAGVQKLLQIRDRVLGVVEDRRRQRRVRLAAGENVEEVVERARRRPTR